MPPGATTVSDPGSPENQPPSQLYFRVMHSEPVSSPGDDALDARTRRLYVWAIVCEALVIVALWAFKLAFA